MKHAAMITGLAAALLLSSSAATEPSAHASPTKTTRVVTYPYKQVMPAAVRYLVIDAKHKVLAANYKAGYILFQIDEGRRTFRGALELVRYTEKRQPMLKLILSIDGRPKWVEAVMINRLLKKLRKQLGVAPEPPEPSPGKKAPAKKADKAKTAKK
jgi:hypothetical protein